MSPEIVPLSEPDPEPVKQVAPSWKWHQKPRFSQFAEEDLSDLSEGEEENFPEPIE